MPVLINFKICDNVEECAGVETCQTGAITWDKENNTLRIDNSKCTNCGACESSCMVNAIKVAKAKDEFEQVKKEFEADPRSRKDLYIDRYGAMPVHPAFLIKKDKFDLEILQSKQLTVVEFFEEETINCLLCSLPIKDLFPFTDIKYRKLEIINPELTTKYDITTLPALLFFKEGKLLGKIEGYYDDKKKKLLLDKIDEIIK
ncbi:4Fe-4S binding protein [Candidatus Woesearchaeota archaeon]|jgi:ferredoxin|nr:4Fe-4S binding protein [Candidatus Woesearchaeota archaeon]MBT3304763.1 4Fe-4S binding protein [Candidatus Woesearchaeota archaeon]MBT4367901.1 4Fe-4S binding protein [Candidatus Woesearchaeota archaeon]MBT4712389.1 4Fe-4S binding protein [Candidatus Woesearchaeota archaeon]MBT6639301.1 4Fe-4S binding protein [Candidatus Woesearchaeota archaeon]